MNNSPNIPVEDRKYVLRFPSRRSMKAKRRWKYYTGKAPTYRLGQARVFSLQQARDARTFAHTTYKCEIKRITDRMLFVAALDGT